MFDVRLWPGDALIFFQNHCGTLAKVRKGSIGFSMPYVGSVKYVCLWNMKACTEWIWFGTITNDGGGYENYVFLGWSWNSRCVFSIVREMHLGLLDIELYVECVEIFFREGGENRYQQWSTTDLLNMQCFWSVWVTCGCMYCSSVCDSNEQHNFFSFWFWVTFSLWYCIFVYIETMYKIYSTFD